VIVSRQMQGSSDLFLVDVESGSMTNLTRSPAASESNASWSPDGERLVAEVVTLDPWAIDLWVLDTGGRRIRQLTHSAPGQWPQTPAWSPDGRQIAYVQGDVLYLVPAQGGQPRAIVTDIPGIGSPTWSPDSRRIAFHAVPDGRLDLFVASADGSAVARINTPDEYEQFPAWSPDGAWIAYSGLLQGFQWVIRRVRPDGSGREDLTVPFSSDESHAAPAWSPDGRYISVTTRASMAEIIEVGLPGTKQPVAPAQPLEGAEWRPDR
jgi:TolB protein